MDFHFRAFCISQYIKERTISLYMPFVKFLKVLKNFIRAFSMHKFPADKPGKRLPCWLQKARYREMR